jgi:hypothetical protein
LIQRIFVEAGLDLQIGQAPFYVRSILHTAFCPES